MSCVNTSGNINETFVIEPIFVGSDILSACTAVYTNFIGSCSGDTSITLGTGIIYITGNLNVDDITATTISATTYLNLPIDVFVTGGTYSANTITFTNNTGGTFDVTGIISSTPFTGGTVSGATEFINGLSANTISATTYLNLPTDVFVTGGSYNNNIITFTNNTGGTFDVTGITASGVFTGGTVNGATLFTDGLSANTISATTYLNLPVDPDTYVTGFTFDPNTYVLALNQNTDNSQYSGFTANLAILASDVTITGGTYNPTTGVATFTNNSGATFDVSGFTSGLTDTVITSFNYTSSANTFTINQSNGSAFTATFSAVSGLTVNGSLNVTNNTFLQSVSATTLFLSAATNPLRVQGLQSAGDTNLLTIDASGVVHTVSTSAITTTAATLYTSDGSLNGNRIVNIDGYTLNFSGSSAQNNLFLSGGSVGIGTSSLAATAVFEISSTSKGFLGPRMTEAQRLAIVNPAIGLVVYQTNADEGYFLYKSFGWVQIM